MKQKQSCIINKLISRQTVVLINLIKVEFHLDKLAEYTHRIYIGETL